MSTPGHTEGGCAGAFRGLGGAANPRGGGNKQPHVPGLHSASHDSTLKAYSVQLSRVTAPPDTGQRSQAAAPGWGALSVRCPLDGYLRSRKWGNGLLQSSSLRIHIFSQTFIRRTFPACEKTRALLTYKDSKANNEPH